MSGQDKVLATWADSPAAHDYRAAQTYLSLLFDPAVATRLAAKMRKVENRVYMAKDLLRASALPILGPDDVHVASDLAKAGQHTPLSPVLLVAGRLGDRPLVVADGYHRICAAFHLDPNADVVTRLVRLDSKR